MANEADPSESVTVLTIALYGVDGTDRRPDEVELAVQQWAEDRGITAVINRSTYFVARHEE